MKTIALLLVLMFAFPCVAQSADKNTSMDPSDEPMPFVPDTQPLDAIQAAVVDYVSSSQTSTRDVDVSVKPLDRRLRLMYCMDPLETTWSPGSRTLGRVTVRVACSAPKPWRVHVQATVTLEGEVWTLARGVSRDDVLTRDMLVTQQVTLGANNSAFTSLGTPIEDIQPWLGYAFAQRVNAGKVLNERMLKPARLVNKGDAVVIRHRASGLELQTRGVALSDAGARQQTQVRNTSSGKIIDVVVVSPGIVEILQ